MGRRDEPELEELSKLLRRLETMEVAPRQESTRQPEPDAAQPQAEYVGALRGAAPAKVSDDRRGSSHDKGAHRGLDAQSRADGNVRSSSTTAIVIGATTAAVVSSVVAAGLVLWINGSGGQKSEGERRLTFYAPTEPSGVSQRSDGNATTPAVRPGTDTSPTNAQALLQRADFYLRSGKPGEARIVLEQAAQLGSGVAALTLGAMYDPGRTTQFSNLEIKADPTVARAWYERAKDLGVAEANDRLAELAAR
jgi:TPR repeat protein